jgi:hypothetical protein
MSVLSQSTNLNSQPSAGGINPKDEYEIPSTKVGGAARQLPRFFGSGPPRISCALVQDLFKDEEDIMEQLNSFQNSGEDVHYVMNCPVGSYSTEAPQWRPSQSV